VWKCARNKNTIRDRVVSSLMGRDVRVVLSSALTNGEKEGR
jgi:hypothetical protein